MQFRILGPLEVECAGAEVDLGRPKQRALLALLLVHANHVVSVDKLVDDLWAGDPPADSHGALQVQVSRLRQVLTAAGVDGQAVLESRKPGYLLRVEDGALDSKRFERLLEAGTRARAEGRPRQAAERLRAALAVWRGAALAEFADQPFAMAEAARLEERRLGAREELVETQLALGEHAEVVAELRHLTADHPLRERLWGQLMLALYRCGRQAEALRAFGELRANLSDELGIAPSPALQRLEEAVLLQKPELDWEPPQAAASAPDRSAGTRRARATTAAAHQIVAIDDETTPFVGRQEELGALHAVWQDVMEGDGPRLVLVAGEPGIGKTRLALELARHAHGQGAHALVGHCDEDLAVPYQPFAEAMTAAIRSLPAGDLGATLAGRGGELARLVPELAELVPGLPPPVPSDPETERYRMFGAVGRVLGALARRAPLVFVVDDVQWAATPTLLLLRHIVSRADPMPLLAIVTYRDTEVGEHHPLKAILGEPGRLPNVSRISLSGLDQIAVARFVTAVADPGVMGHPSLANAIHRGTAGNPLFVREMVRHLNESPAGAGGVAADVPADVPEGVRVVVRRRLSRLSADTNRLLAVASVAGAEFDLAVVQAASRLDDEAVATAAEEAIHAGLVAEVRGAGAVLRLRFTHALVRATLYEGLTGPRRAQLHRKVGEATEAGLAGRLEDHLPALARHFTAAAPIGAAHKAVHYSTRAGDQALAQLAHEEAAQHYAQALALLDGLPEGPDPSRRLDLLLALGEAQKRCGAADHRQTLLDAAALAVVLGDPERLAAAALANTRSFWSATRRVDAERVQTLEAALERLGDADSPLRARLLGKLAVELVYSGDAPGVRALSDEALAMARRLRDLPTLASVLAPRYNTIRGDPGTLPERIANTTELVAVAEQLPDPSLRCEAWGWRGVAAVEAADPDHAAASFEVFDRLAGQLHQPTMLWYSAYLSAGRAQLAGRFEEAERLAAEAFRLGQAAGQPDAEMFFSAQRLQLAYETGALPRWERALQVALTRDPASAPFLRSWQALCADEAGRAEHASATFAELAAKDFADLAFEPTWLHVVTNCAIVCAHVGDPQHGARLFELIEPYAGQWVTLSSLANCGSVSFYLAVLASALGRFAEADTLFADSAATHQRMGAPAWLARTRLEWACSLLDPERPDQDDRRRHAHQLAAAALATASELGMRTVAARARALVPDGAEDGGATTGKCS